MASRGGVLGSTPVTRSAVHAEGAVSLVNHGCKKIVANDDNFALAA